MAETKSIEKENERFDRALLENSLVKGIELIAAHFERQAFDFSEHIVRAKGFKATIVR